MSFDFKAFRKALKSKTEKLSWYFFSGLQRKSAESELCENKLCQLPAGDFVVACRLPVLQIYFSDKSCHQSEIKDSTGVDRVRQRLSSGETRAHPVNLPPLLWTFLVVVLWFSVFAWLNCTAIPPLLCVLCLTLEPFLFFSCHGQ